MSAIAFTFDTLQFSKSMQEAGMPAQQAEVLANAQKAYLNEIFTSQQFVTKPDLKELEQALKADIKDLEASTKAEIASTKADIAALEQKTKMGMLELKMELTAKMDANKHNLLRWLFGIAVAQVTLIVAILTYFK